MSNEKYGFVYIWYDRKHKRYYIGSHWGTEDDGYICSSTWMRNSFKRRPKDFKRRILEKVQLRENLYEAENKWLGMIKEEIKTRYYNLNLKAGHWTQYPKHIKTISEKISVKTKEAMQRPEVRKKYEKGLKKRDNKSSNPEVIGKRRRSMTETLTKKFPVENRYKPLTDQERWEYYSQKGKEIWANRNEDQRRKVGQKISEGLKGKKNRLGQTNSDEHRKKISETLKKNGKKCKRVCVLGKVYNSVKQAVEETGVPIATMTRRLNSDKYPDYTRIQP